MLGELQRKARQSKCAERVMMLLKLQSVMAVQVHLLE